MISLYRLCFSLYLHLLSLDLDLLPYGGVLSRKVFHTAEYRVERVSCLMHPTTWVINLGVELILYAARVAQGEELGSCLSIRK